MKANVYQMVTDRIVEMINAGVTPWKKPWGGAKMTGETCAINYVTRRAYSVLNQWLLGKPGEWLSFNQIKDNGGHIRKGEKSSFVVFYTKAEYKTTDEDGKEKVVTYPLLKYYNVWHIDQTEGVKSKIVPGEKIEVDTNADADAIINDYVAREAIKFYNDRPSDRAYYSPFLDEVVVPMPGQYKNIGEYYSTTFHELVHSTMKSTRCDREVENKGAFFGNHNYSREELVAEMGGAMLCSVTGVEDTRALQNSASYIKGWLRPLKEDPRMIVWASSRAEKAAKYILNEIDAK